VFAVAHRCEELHRKTAELSALRKVASSYKESTCSNARGKWVWSDEVPTSFCTYSPERVEGVASEVGLLLYGVLRSSPKTCKKYCI